MYGKNDNRILSFLFMARENGWVFKKGALKESYQKRIARFCQFFLRTIISNVSSHLGQIGLELKEPLKI